MCSQVPRKTIYLKNKLQAVPYFVVYSRCTVHHAIQLNAMDILRKGSMWPGIICSRISPQPLAVCNITQLRHFLPSAGSLAHCTLNSRFLVFVCFSTRRWILNGVFVSVIQLWFAWQVSGAYPSSLTVADPWIAAGGLCVLIIGIVEAEKSIESYRKAGVMQQPCPSHKKSKNVFLKKDQERGDVLQRYGKRHE